MAAPALLTHEVAEGDLNGGSGRLHRMLASNGFSRLLAALSASEMLADKSSLVGDRTDVLPLAARAAMGSFTAAAFASERRHRPLLPAAVGAAAAIASTYAAFHLRRFAGRHLSVPDSVLGMVEDAVVVAASGALSEFLEELD